MQSRAGSRAGVADPSGEDQACAEMDRSLYLRAKRYAEERVRGDQAQEMGYAKYGVRCLALGLRRRLVLVWSPVGLLRGLNKPGGRGTLRNQDRKFDVAGS
jgi:hypothetical protein